MDNPGAVAPQHACSDGQNCLYRQILPVRLRPVNQYEAKLGHIRGRELSMRIYGPNGTNLSSPAGNARRTSSSGFALPDAGSAPANPSRPGSSGFALPDAGSAPKPRAATAPKAAANIDALLAMQGIGED